ncbi:MAG: restriction endonuclease subunit S [Bacteroidia bacterium]
MNESWEIKDLGSVCHVQRGLTYSGKDTVDISDQVVLRATNIDLGTGKLIFDELKYLREDLEIKPIYSLKKNSLLICFSSGSKSHLGKIALVNDDYPNFYFGGFIGQINPSDKIDSKYLFYCLSSEAYKDYISNLTDGVNINNLKATDLKAFQIPLPPLPEQQRIVSILDRAFAAIDKAKANAEQNLKNAKELFESYLEGVFENGKWELKKWGELCDFVRGPFGGSLKKSVFKESGFAVYEQKHAIHDHFNQLRYFIDEEKFNEMKRFELLPGDIIMSCSGVTLGRVAVVPEGIPRGVINQALLKLTPKKNVSVHFIKYWLRSNIFQKIIFDYAGGAAIPNVPSAKILKEILIPFPLLKEQERIVSQIEIVLSESKKLESIYQKKMDDLEELKKSILQKAFAGELETKTLETA